MFKSLLNFSEKRKKHVHKQRTNNGKAILNMQYGKFKRISSIVNIFLLPNGNSQNRKLIVWRYKTLITHIRRVCQPNTLHSKLRRESGKCKWGKMAMGREHSNFLVHEHAAKIRNVAKRTEQNRTQNIQLTAEIVRAAKRKIDAEITRQKIR